MYKLIDTFSEFILNETLKTHDVDLSIKNINTELSLMRYNFEISKKDNIIELLLKGFRYIQNPHISLEHINSLFIDRHGWYPSKMILFDLVGSNNILSYDEEYLYDKIQYLETVTIIYEPKFDLLIKNPNKCYHLSIQEYENSTLGKGLMPKSKSKLSRHLDRIYLCKDVSDCYNLIAKMKADYMIKKKGKSKINTKWIIYEINMIGKKIDLYEDPNYKDKGFYCVDNIEKDRIKIYDKEI